MAEVNLGLVQTSEIVLFSEFHTPSLLSIAITYISCIENMLIITTVKL